VIYGNVEENKLGIFPRAYLCPGILPLVDTVLILGLYDNCLGYAVAQSLFLIRAPDQYCSD
jgi:hypothetical protein